MITPIRASNPPRRIAVFFYGSFIRREVMAKGGLVPAEIVVARLSGYDIHIGPHASIWRSDQHSMYGVLVNATHDELQRLYSMEGVGVFLPEAVLVEAPEGQLRPALCYMAPVKGDQPADQDYLEKLIAAALGYGFPDWYLRKLEHFRGDNH